MIKKDKFYNETVDKCADASLTEKLLFVMERQDAAKEKVFADLGDVEKFRDLAKDVRNDVLANLDTYLATFTDKLKEAGVNVHFAEDAKQARDIIAKVAKDNNVSKIVKSKSMITEEIHLNEALEADNIEVTETDLGEFISGAILFEAGPTQPGRPAGARGPDPLKAG